MKDMNYVYMSTSMEALCRHVNKNKSQGGGPPLSREKSRDVLEQPPQYLLKQEDSS